MRRMMINRNSSAAKMLGVGLILFGSGLVLMSPALGQDPVSTTPTATRYISIFDQPPQATAQPTVDPADTAAPQAAPSETPMPQVTRYQSMFDPPAQLTAAPSADSGAPTRIPSIFDPPAQPTAAPGSAGPTRIPSIFDTQAQPTAESGASAQPTPYRSVLDAVQPDIIRFDEEGPPDREYCLTCHASEFLQMSLPSGESISVTFDEEAYRNSVHGQHGTEGYLCIRCHEGMNEYPHAEVTSQTARDLTLDLSTSCQRCHPDKYLETLDGLHTAQLASGNKNAAVCSDCHGAHTVTPLSDPITGDRLPDADRASVAMCSSCHSEVYERYTSSVHGKALLEGNPDVPTCADCHGIHDTQGPTDSSFRLFSPQICANCHADDELMAEYGISTDVFDTYVADFHGTTVAIFQNTAPDHDFNAAVCTDCHGVHNIAAMDEASSPVLKENLVSTCQRCHPSATANFPDAWMSHYQPTFERTPLVALANTVYMIGIPAIVGGLGLFVMSDVRRRRKNRCGKE